jgi:chemotaxis protein histidine kinase CheA/ActR/RegA family two-component response regulator
VSDADGFDFDEDETLMLRNFFRDEAHDYLEGITRRLLHASKTQLDTVAIAELMRTTHTLKGSAATVGLKSIAAVAHDIEDCFAKLRSNTLQWSENTSERLVEVIDSLRSIVDSVEDSAVTAQLVSLIRAQLAAVDTAAADSGAAEGEVQGEDAPENVPTAEAVPAVLDDDSEPEARPRRVTEPMAVPVVTEPAVVETGSIPMEAAEAERRRDDAQVLRIDAGRIDRLMNGVGELVFDRTRIERRMADLRRLVRDLSKTRQRLRDQIEPLRGVDTVLAQSVLETENELAGHVAHLARSTSSLVDDAEALRQTTQTLQDGLTHIRMSSIRVLFQRLARSLREFARTAGKRIELITSGEDTEFDKLVADQIADPLLQILRNAVAHGIEDEDERIIVGKPPVGQIRLHARQEGDAVWIELHDDGQGIDTGVLRGRLVDSGQWTRDKASTATDGEILRAIFETGVSTRVKTDSLAGRGVGLDSVRENIARIGGDIRVESTRGVGTTFNLRVPVTTAVSQALLFKIQGNVYAIPNVHVLETSYIEASSPVIPKHLRLKDEVVPLVVLQSVIGAPPPKDARRVPAVVVEYAGKRLAITCDRVIGPRELIVKSLGPLLSALPLFAGGTISGSGKVQLIFDSSELVRLAFPDQPDALRTDRPKEVEHPASSASRVLVADDSRAVRETLNRMLAGAGFVVDTAVDGARAFEMLHETRYDALVTDLELPRLGGFELLEKLRADGELSALPAIVISSRTSRANRDRAKSLGARTFIPKPVTRRKLITALSKILDEPE